MPLPDFAQPVDMTLSAGVAFTITKRIIVRDCIVLASVDGNFPETGGARYGFSSVAGVAEGPVSAR